MLICPCIVSSAFFNLALDLLILRECPFKYILAGRGTGGLGCAGGGSEQISGNKALVDFGIWELSAISLKSRMSWSDCHGKKKWKAMEQSYA
jgi:hypothetical protein